MTSQELIKRYRMLQCGKAVMAKSKPYEREQFIQAGLLLDSNRADIKRIKTVPSLEPWGFQ